MTASCVQHNRLVYFLPAMARVKDLLVREDVEKNATDNCN